MTPNPIDMADHGYDMMGPPVHLAAPGSAPASAGDAEIVVPLKGPEGLFDPRTRAVMLSVLSVLGAIGAAGLVVLVSVAFSVWGTRFSWTPVAVTFAAVAVTGIAVSWLTYLPWRRPMYFAVGPDWVRIASPSFAKPFFVPRNDVKVVDVDPRPRSGWRDVNRFLIEGNVPEEARADALDRSRTPPGEPIPPSPVPRDPAATMSAPPGPDDAGWAAYKPHASSPPPAQETSPAYLYTGEGSALPVLRFDPRDLPNVALLFNKPLRAPSTPPLFALFGGGWTPISMFHSQPVSGKTLKGLMVSVGQPERAAQAIGRWGILRHVRAGEVLSQGIRPPKPLRGWRAIVFFIVATVPSLLRMRMRRTHGFAHPGGWTYLWALPFAALFLFGVIAVENRRWKRNAARHLDTLLDSPR